MRPESLSRFLRDWWPLHGVVRKARSWLFIYVKSHEYAGTVCDYACLFSADLKKLVIYINGKSGEIDQFSIFEHGILCPLSQEQAEGFGNRRTHESWFVKNRLSDWGFGREARRSILNLLGEADTSTSETMLRLPISKVTINHLAQSLFESWRLPKVWCEDNVDAVATHEDSWII